MINRHFSVLPKPYTAYPKILQQLLLQVKSKATAKMVADIRPSHELASNLRWVKAKYIVEQLYINREHLEKYNAITGFNNDGTVPALYLAVLAQSLQMQMMAHEDFPFAILGLVHIGNQITQHRVIKADECLRLSCAFGELRPHDKGQQFDFIIKATVGNETVMEGLTTYLYRQKSTQTPIEHTQASPSPTEQLGNLTTTPTASWKLQENTGRRYALVSGDLNLIHLHALTAKAFGFKQAIAHGMWSNARALAALQPLPAAYQSEVHFKLPIFLPSTVEFLTDIVDKNTDFLLRSAKDHKPHLTGRLTAL